MALNSVVLPAPLEPRIARRLAGRDRERDVVDRAQRAEGARHAFEHERVARQQRAAGASPARPRGAVAARGRAT